MKNNETRTPGLLSGFMMGIVLLFAGEIFSDVVITLVSRIFPGSWANSLEAQLFGFAGIILSVVLWSVLVEKRSLKGLGLSSEGAFRDFIKGWGLGAAVLTFTVLVMILTGSVRIHSVNFSFDILFRLCVLFFAWSVQGSAEEILARGWLFNGLSLRYSRTVAVISSSVFFTLLHGLNPGMGWIPVLDLFLFAVLACLLMMKTGSVWCISGYHAAWNCFQGNIFAFPVSGTQAGSSLISVSVHGSSLLSGGAFGVEGSLVSVLIQLGLILYLLWERKKEYNGKRIKGE